MDAPALLQDRSIKAVKSFLLPRLVSVVLTSVVACAPVEDVPMTVVQTVSSAPISAQCSTYYWNRGDCDLVVAVPSTQLLRAQVGYRAYPFDGFGSAPAPLESGRGNDIYTSSPVTTVRLDMYELSRSWRNMCRNSSSGYYSPCVGWLLYAWSDSRTYVRLVVELVGNPNDTSTMPNVQTYYYPNFYTDTNDRRWTLSYAIRFTEPNTRWAQSTVNNPSQPLSPIAGQTQFVLPSPLSMMLGSRYPDWAASL